MAERRHTADRESRRLAHLVGRRPAHVVPYERRVDAAVARTQHEDGPRGVDEHERLHDLAELAAGSGRRLLGRARRRVELLHVDVEAGSAEPLGHLQGCRVHRGHRWVPRWATRIFSIGVPQRGHGSPSRS